MRPQGSAVCPNCGRLVAAAADRCPHCGRLAPGLWGGARLLQRVGGELGLANLVTAVCVLLYAVALALDWRGIGMSSLFGLLAPSSRGLVELGASGKLPVFDLGRWWTVLSAGWLHGSLLHIVFNLLWVRQLAPAVVRLYGAGRATLVYLASGAAGFLLTSVVGAVSPFSASFLRGAHLTVGASAAVFGLMGALVVYGRRTGSRGLGQQVWVWAGSMLLLGFLLPVTDNFAHLGGFLGGTVVARLLDPLRQEKPEHVLAALLGLGLSAAAIVASALVPLP
ncbi:MAG: rhomboid family intramembrane serine protease [Thermoanaerobaculia bacterium]